MKFCFMTGTTRRIFTSDVWERRCKQWDKQDAKASWKHDGPVCWQCEGSVFRNCRSKTLFEVKNKFRVIQSFAYKAVKEKSKETAKAVKKDVVTFQKWITTFTKVSMKLGLLFHSIHLALGSWNTVCCRLSGLANIYCSTSHYTEIQERGSGQIFKS